MEDGFRILERFLHTANVRHGVIASNIANVDTPEYRAKEVKFEQMLDSEIGLKKTNPKHMNNSSFNPSEDINIETTQQWADKNNVEMDMEVAKMIENAILFQAGISFFSTKIKMFKAALRR